VAAPAGAPLLAVETATERAGAALLRGAEVVAVRHLAPQAPAAEHLLPALVELLAEAGLPIEAVGYFAVSIGPGSFTGLRVGVSTVKGLAFGTGARVAPVPTLAALAARVGPAEGPIAAVLDARRGEVYGAVYPAAGGEPLVGPAVHRPEAFAACLPETCGTVVGGGVSLVAGAVRARLGPRVELIAPPAGACDPIAVGRLGARLLAAGRGVSAAALVPFYGRRAEAEVRRMGSRQEPRTDPARNL
jgi:tRNA threonylcarbamoyladenosine biosynthesis protein TsaB